MTGTDDHASPRPWTYHTAPSRHGIGNRDWIEDATGAVILENVGHLDGPMICRAVNFFTEVEDAERELQIGLATLSPPSLFSVDN